MSKITFLEKINPDTIIWKYFNLMNFLYLIKEKKMFFSNIYELIDKYEGELPLSIIFSSCAVPIGGMSNHYKKDRIAHEKFKNDVKSINHVAVNCWTLNKPESFALWKIYVENSFGIALKSNIGKIEKAIKDTDKTIYASSVQYTSKEVSENDINSIITNKREFYSFEREFRLFIKSDSSKGINVPIDCDELIDTLYLSPFMPDYAKKVIRELIHDNNLKINKNQIKDSIIKLRQ